MKLARERALSVDDEDASDADDDPVSADVSQVLLMSAIESILTDVQCD